VPDFRGAVPKARRQSRGRRVCRRRRWSCLTG
jgi:hypothetical protein